MKNTRLGTIDLSTPIQLSKLLLTEIFMWMPLKMVSSIGLRRNWSSDKRHIVKFHVRQLLNYQFVRENWKTIDPSTEWIYVKSKINQFEEVNWENQNDFKPKWLP